MNANDVSLSRIRLGFHSEPIQDLRAVIRRELEKLRGDIKPGMRIAMTVGSRGIADIDQVARYTADYFKELGAEPFIVPAMGSHGGATAEGQRRVLADYGITEETMGVPICSSMEVKALGRLPENENVLLYMDRYAYEADKVFVINRVKSHTDFHGENESGIVKMLVIGLGKQAQAVAAHEYMLPGLRENIPAIARAIIKTGKILGALALVEDGYDQLSVAECARPEDILAVDARLLKHSKKIMARLPFQKCDVLLIDWMGKNITGSGVDTNIIGRLRVEGERNSEGPDIMRICIFDLTEQSHGNALGVGLADVVTKKLADKIDWDATYENVLTSRFVERGFLPIVRNNERAVIDTALYTCGHVTPDTVRLAHIADTLHLSEMTVSDALLKDIQALQEVEVLESGVRFRFDEAGNLC